MNDWFLSPHSLPQIVFSIFIDPLSSCPLTLEQHVKRSFTFASVNTSDLPGSSKSCSTSPCLETSPSGGFHCFCSQRYGYILSIEGIYDLLNILAAHDFGIGIWGSQGWGANKEECTSCFEAEILAHSQLNTYCLIDFSQKHKVHTPYLFS